MTGRSSFLVRALLGLSEGHRSGPVSPIPAHGQSPASSSHSMRTSMGDIGKPIRETERPEPVRVPVPAPAPAPAPPPPEPVRT